MMVQLMVRLWSLDGLWSKKFEQSANIEGDNYAKIGHKPHTAVSPVQGGYKREERNQPADGE